VTSSWFFLSTLNYDARSTTHQISVFIYFPILSELCVNTNTRNLKKNSEFYFDCDV